MRLYILAEHDDLEDIGSAIYNDIQNWATALESVECIGRGLESHPQCIGSRMLEIGIEFDVNVKKPKQLKEPVNGLYKIALVHGCDFVIGQIVDQKYEDVCYFGKHEGRPDIYEIANYLNY